MEGRARSSRLAPAVAVRVFASLLVARAMFGLVYLAASLGEWPLFWYLPIERRWELAVKPSGFAMGWFGLTAAALFAGAVGGAIAFAATARGPLARALARTSFVLAIAHAGGLVLLVDFAYFGWKMTHQAATPLPDHECPRAP